MQAVFMKTSKWWRLTGLLWLLILLSCAAHPPARRAEAIPADVSFPTRMEGLNTATISPVKNTGPHQPARIEGLNPAEIGPLNTTDQNLCYNLGVYFYSQGELNAAMKKLKETIKQQPQHGESHALLGLIYEEKGKKKKAEKEFAAAAQTQPTLNKFRCQVAAFYKQKGMKCLLQSNPDQAMSCLQKSITFIPQDEDTKQLLAFSFCLLADRCTAGNQGRPAADYYQQARKLYPALPAQRTPTDFSVWPAWVQDNFIIDHNVNNHNINYQK
jgi:tetratricopeptide (TPR) repeat protein